MAVRVENCVFFPEKNELLITRGGRHRVVVFNQGGLMVRLNGFQNYYLNVKTGEVCSERKGKYVPLKKHLEGAHVYYFLFMNGVRERVPHFRILRENLKEIEEFFSKSGTVLNSSRN